MNILITMAGRGQRFKNVGFNLPKPLIDVAGKPMIQRVVENLDVQAHYIFVVQEQHYEMYNLEYLLNKITRDTHDSTCTIIKTDGVTEGQASSALLAKEYIDSNQPLLIVNADNYLIWDVEEAIGDIDKTIASGAIFTFKDEERSPNWSYADVDDNGWVKRIAEKDPISDHALAGAFYWKHGRYFVNCAEQMISKDIRTNGEFYIAPVFNEAIGMNDKVLNYSLSMKSMGTPEELEEFLSWIEMKKASLTLDEFMTSFSKHNKERKKKLDRKMQNALDELREGKPIILVDEYDRENEGDVVIAAEKADVKNLAFAMRYARGLMCFPCTGELLDRLEIPPMVQNNTDPNETPFTVSVDGHDTTTGMSVHDKLRTIELLLDPKSKPEDLTRPGHLFPLRARDRLLKERRGHTEGSIQLMKLADLLPAAIIVEIQNDDGTMTKGGDLNKFAVEHGLSIVSIEEVYEATYNESL